MCCIFLVLCKMVSGGHQQGSAPDDQRRTTSFEAELSSIVLQATGLSCDRHSMHHCDTLSEHRATAVCPCMAWQLASRMWSARLSRLVMGASLQGAPWQLMIAICCWLCCRHLTRPLLPNRGARQVSQGTHSQSPLHIPKCIAHAPHHSEGFKGHSMQHTKCGCELLAACSRVRCGGHPPHNYRGSGAHRQ
jgi:hypothetical protein